MSFAALPPGARIGIIGGGQLGRMLALAGTPLGYTFRFLEPADPCPADGLGEVVRGGYADSAAIDAFARGLDVVTYEFENVPAETAEALAARLPVHPTPASLALARDRLHEKQGFEALGIDCAPWRRVDDRASLERAVQELGLPAVLKTRRLGYDGKGQAVLHSPDDLDPAWQRLGDHPLVLEGFVRFERELSIVAVRGHDGAFAAWPVVENRHERGVLVHTRAPALHVDAARQLEAEALIRRLMDHLGHVGVMALELFEVDGHLKANEVAPRVHNSGHWTQNGAQTSQFENHIRAIAGLPLGSCAAAGVTEMVNLLGALPGSEVVLGEPLAHLHLYGKSPRPGRKIGHVNVTGPSADAVREATARIQAALPPDAGPAA